MICAPVDRRRSSGIRILSPEWPQWRLSKCSWKEAWYASEQSSMQCKLPTWCGLKDTDYKTPRKKSIPGKPVCVHRSVEREVKFDHRFCGDATVAYLKRGIPRWVRQFSASMIYILSTPHQFRHRTVASVKMGTKLSFHLLFYAEYCLLTESACFSRLVSLE